MTSILPTAGTMCNDKNLIGKPGEYMTKMFLFSVFNLIKKDKGISEEKCTGIFPTGVKPVTLRLLNVVQIFTATVLAQLVEHVTAKQKVAGSIPGTGPILSVLKETEK